MHVCIPEQHHRASFKSVQDEHATRTRKRNKNDKYLAEFVSCLHFYSSFVLRIYFTPRYIQHFHLSLTTGNSPTRVLYSIRVTRWRHFLRALYTWSYLDISRYLAYLPLPDRGQFPDTGLVFHTVHQMTAFSTGMVQIWYFGAVPR